METEAGISKYVLFRFDTVTFYTYRDFQYNGHVACHITVIILQHR